MRTIQIARRAGLSAADFSRDHLERSGSPVVVTGAIEQWPARSKWTFAFLKAAYGAETVFPTAGMWSAATRAVKLADYIDYLDAPANLPRGFWIDPASRRPLAQPVEAADSPLYLMGWHAFQAHPELYADIQPAPAFIEDWVLTLTPAVRDALERTSTRDYWSVYVGPVGSRSRLHLDFWHTHSYLAQVQGAKRCLLFSPDDTACLYDGRVDPETPDLEKFPSFQGATAYEAVIGPGDVLYTPPGWWHHVRGLEKSITVSHNFFNGANASEYLTALMRTVGVRV